jgi:hypothetical protein
MLHISCHGGYIRTGEMSDFYLSIEEVKSAREDKFTIERLKTALKVAGGANNSSVVCAFVSACHSEQIGNVFRKAGVPVVIAVNANTTVLDQACKLFSQSFYSFLLEGTTIKEAFKLAQENIRL